MTKLRQVPDQEYRNEIMVDHPRYLVIPKLGMNLTPHTLYRALRKRFHRLLAAGERFDVIDVPITSIQTAWRRPGWVCRSASRS